MGEQQERIFVHPQPLWEQREPIHSTDLEGQGSQQSHVKSCFHLPSSAAIWVIKLACTTATQNTFPLLWPLDSLNKNYFQKFNTYHFKNRFLFWVSNIQPLWKSGLQDLSSYCVMASLCIFFYCYFEVDLKSSISYKMVEATAKFREQLDFVKLAFI